MQITKTKFTLRAHVACSLLAAVLGAVLFVASSSASAQPDGPVAGQTTAVSVERLVAEFGPWIGKADDAEGIATTLLSGRATNTQGAASVPPATGALGYGEARLALKLAQGALAQQGITNPDADQLRAALHGGDLRTAQGPQAMPGVLQQKVQGTGWGAMATSYGLSAQDMLPPPRPHVAHAASHTKAKHDKHGKASNAKSKGKQAATKGAAKKAVAKQAGKKAGSVASAKKPAAKVPPKKAPPKRHK